MDKIEFDKKIMTRCIELAKLGIGNAAPNPIVGSVVVHNNKIIGEGYHQKCGDAHAEVNAIKSVKNKILLPESTIYVTLEPCAHFGKTPPCADLIVENNIPNVVIGMQDPFAKVNGLGIKKLKDAGCNVTVGVMEQGCKEINRPFITMHREKRPYIILKWAQTMDGFIDKDRSIDAPQQPNWITDEVCRALVHKWRSESQAIMAGPNTINTDNPSLNVRSWSGKNPVRIVLDRKLSLPHNLNVFDKKQETWVFNTVKSEKDKNLYFIKIDDANFLKNVLEHLYENNIQSVFVEGGKIIHQKLIDVDLWDEARVFTGNITFKNGVKSPTIEPKITSREKINDNYLTIFRK